MLALASVTAGLLAPPRRGRDAVLAVTATAALAYAAALAWRADATLDWAIGGGHVVHVLADGMIAATFARVLLKSADVQDEAAAARAAAEAIDAEARQREQDRLRVARAVHDT